MRKFKVWLSLFSKISSERLGDKPYFGIFGQSFVQMDEDIHPHQNKSVDQFLEGHGLKCFDSEKICKLGSGDTFLTGSAELC